MSGDNPFSTPLSQIGKEFAYQAHNSTNHFYDEELPYTFHLQLVVKACKRFAINHFDPNMNQILEAAGWCHDTIEDTRVSYNELLKTLGLHVANIVYALSNEKGRTRSERANDKYYAGIKADKRAVFIKLCDRIANVGYSKLMQSNMFTKYKKENEEFIQKIGAEEHGFKDMIDHLDKLFNE